MKHVTKISSATALLIASVAILFSYSGCSSKDESKGEAHDKTSVVSKPAVELRITMRKVWEDHVSWTRNVILCLVDGLPGTDQAVKRLLQNQVDIGNAFKPYYGAEAGKKLTDILFEHINISAEVVKAAKSGKSDALDKANKKWFANADEISEFLSKANSEWAFADMKEMMDSHLRLTTDEAMQRIKKNYDADVVAYDTIHKEILIMADMLADGIAKQFPEKFTTGATK